MGTLTIYEKLDVLLFLLAADTRGGEARAVVFGKIILLTFESSIIEAFDWIL